MKVAVSSTGKDLASTVDPRFGRAAYFLIIETDSRAIVEVIDNLESQNAAHGAGINAASRIAESGARAILTGQVGPKAAAVCDKAGIAIINNMEGTVQEAIDTYVTINNQKNVPPPSQTPGRNTIQGGGCRAAGGSGRGMGQGGGCRAAGGSGRGMGQGGGCRAAGGSGRGMGQGGGNRAAGGGGRGLNQSGGKKQSA